MIHIYLNDEIHHIDSTQSLQDFLINNKQAASHFAVAINNKLVPRTSYGVTTLQAGDRIDMIVPMQGG